MKNNRLAVMISAVGATLFTLVAFVFREPFLQAFVFPVRQLLWLLPGWGLWFLLSVPWVYPAAWLLWTILLYGALRLIILGFYARKPRMQVLEEIRMGLIGGLLLMLCAMFLEETAVGRSLPYAEDILFLLLAPTLGIVMTLGILVPVLGYLMFEPMAYITSAILWAIIITDVLLVIRYFKRRHAAADAARRGSMGTESKKTEDSR